MIAHDPAYFFPRLSINPDEWLTDNEIFIIIIDHIH